jgi:hypothetical protein
MDNYEARLSSIHPEELPSPKSNIFFGDFAELISVKRCNEYEKSLRQLAKKLPYKVASWPSFGEYIEDWYRVEIGVLKRQLLYCERGSCDVRESCENLIDLSYHILNIGSPRLTSSASIIAGTLDRIKDQRLLIWLNMSSEIYHSFQANKYFGMRMLNSNVTWMCEELVRMGVENSTADAFNNEVHITKGLMLSGMPAHFAADLYHELQNA